MTPVLAMPMMSGVRESVAGFWNGKVSKGPESHSTMPVSPLKALSAATAWAVLPSELSFSQISTPSSAMSKAKLLPIGAAMTAPSSSAVRLEIHPEDRRGSATVLAGMIEAVDLIDDRLDLDAVIPLDAIDRAGEVAARNRHRAGRRGMKAERCDQTDVGGAEIGIDLRSKEIVDICARPVDDLVFGIMTVDDIVGRM